MSILDWLKDQKEVTIENATRERDHDEVFISREKLFDSLNFLKNNQDHPFNVLLDICGVDYMGQTPRFEVIYHLYSLGTPDRLRVRVKVDEKDLVVPSVIKIWETADWYEREAYDMFGIRFDGHPNLKRLLMWEEFEGYPLRKDYPIDKRQPIPEPSDLV